MKQVFRPTCKLEPPLAEHSANRLKDLHSSPHKPSPEAEETEEVAVQDYSCSRLSPESQDAHLWSHCNILSCFHPFCQSKASSQTGNIWLRLGY